MKWSDFIAFCKESGIEANDPRLRKREVLDYLGFKYAAGTKNPWKMNSGSVWENTNK